MKFIVLIFALVLMTCEVARCAPPSFQLASDPQLDLSDGDFVRLARQTQQRDSPLAQLLRDALNIPQVALQAVSQLLTNPQNIIGKSTNPSNQQY